MEWLTWISRGWWALYSWILITALIAGLHLGSTSEAVAAEVADNDIVSLSDLEQSETFLNIISSVSSGPPVEVRDYPGTIPIRHINHSGHDLSQATEASTRDQSTETHSTVQEDTKRVPQKQKGIRRRNVFSSSGTSKGRPRNKMRKRKSRPKNDTEEDTRNALSLRHPPDEDANDNSLSGISHDHTRDQAEQDQSSATKGQQRKVKRRRKEKKRKQSEEEEDITTLSTVPFKQRQLPKNVRRRLRSRGRLQKEQRHRLLLLHRRKKQHKTTSSSAPVPEQENTDLGRQRTRTGTTSFPGKTTEFHSAAVVRVVGDLSCMKGEFRAAPSVLNADINYSRNVDNGHELAWLDARYVCLSGYELKGSGTPLLCRNREWIGPVPSCAPALHVHVEAVRMREVNESLCPSSHGLCEQLCSVNRETGQHECSCFRGFAMQEDGRCGDIDECREDVCQSGTCINTRGSFRCYCSKGFRLDGSHCVDVNECLLRNNHGPCQDVCTNTQGSFECSCEGLPGTVLAGDGQRCEYVDACEKDNGGCSHTCLSANGRAVCDCPSGWTLDPVQERQCLDVNECATEGLSDCQFSCVNTLGSYKCVPSADYGTAADQPVIEQVLSCPPGRSFNSSTGICEDEDECQVHNGGCSDVCTNTIGSFHCSCRDGFIFAADNFSCVVNNRSADGLQVTCPPLFPPRHGYLECTRSLVESGGRRRRVTNQPGTACILKCPLGYYVVGSYAKVCGSNGNWTGTDNGTCAKHPPVSLVCPKSVRQELTSNETSGTTVFRVPSPKAPLLTMHAPGYQSSALLWKISPPLSELVLQLDHAQDYGRVNDAVVLPVGKYTFTYSGSVDGLKASCDFTVEILDGTPPQLLSCPSEQIVTVGNQYETTQVYWTPPEFVDNVAVTSVTSSNLPGSSMGLGSHKITYTATDAAGYSTKCVFRILVRLPKWKYFKYLQLPRDI